MSDFAAIDANRRQFLLGGACSVAAMAAPKLSFAAVPGDNRLVVIVLRGAMDGLDVVVPYGDPALRSLRPNLARLPGKAENGRSLHDLDGFFGLHEDMWPLLPLWQAGELALVHAVATPYRDGRSHFDGQDILENGHKGANDARDGWLNRALAHLPGRNPNYAMTVGRDQMLLLSGKEPAGVWSPRADLTLHEQGSWVWEAIYKKDPLFEKAAREAQLLDATTDKLRNEMNGGMGITGNDPAALAGFAAKLLNAEARIAAFAVGGWDTHRRQIGAIRQPLRQLASALTTLKDGLGPNWARTMVLCLTEFGRTARENGTGGTDHGTGGLLIWAGGAMATKGKVLGQWPGLNALYDDRDLLPTSDLRAWVAQALMAQFPLSREVVSNHLFPGVEIGPRPNFL